MTPLKLEMVSDLVCPWCWLGLRRMQTALGRVSDDVAIDVAYMPFQLDPTVPAEGVPYKDYMRAKFGGTGEDGPQKDRFAQMREALETYGEAEGIPFDFPGITHRPNTLNAHRLVRWAQGQERGLAVKEALFHAYFADHRDIGDTGVLADIGAENGMDRALLADLLAGDADKEATNAEEAFFRSAGIQGVPAYVINRSRAVQGAEDPDRLVKYFETSARELAA